MFPDKQSDRIRKEKKVSYVKSLLKMPECQHNFPISNFCIHQKNPDERRFSVILFLTSIQICVDSKLTLMPLGANSLDCRYQTV